MQQSLLYPGAAVGRAWCCSAVRRVRRHPGPYIASPIPNESQKLSAAVSSVEFNTKMVDRQVGRNAELFAGAIADLGTPEDRYPYLRILVSIVEQAHPEWNQAPKKDRQIAHLVIEMAPALNEDEVAEVVRVRDEERGYYYD